MDENKNINPEVETEGQVQPAESVEAPVEEMWNAPVAEQPAEPTEPAEQPQALTASNTSVGDNVAQPIYVDPSAMFEKNTADHGYAVTSLVLGIIGLVMCCCGGMLSMILGVVGLILGIMARKHGNNEGISLAGIIVSAISLGLGLIVFLFSIVYWIALMGGMYSVYPDLFETMPDDYIKLFRPF